MAVSRDEPSYAEFTRSQSRQRFHKETWTFIHNYTIRHFIASRVLPRFYRHDVHCSYGVSFLQIILFSKSIMIFLLVTGSPRRDWVETVRELRLKNRGEGGENRDVPRHVSRHDARHRKDRNTEEERTTTDRLSLFAAYFTLDIDSRSYCVHLLFVPVFHGCLSIILFHKCDFHWHILKIFI